MTSIESRPSALALNGTLAKALDQHLQTASCMTTRMSALVLSWRTGEAYSWPATAVMFRTRGHAGACEENA